MGPSPGCEELSRDLRRGQCKLITVPLLEFARLGTFGPVGLKAHRDQVRSFWARPMIGAIRRRIPTAQTSGSTVRQSSISQMTCSGYAVSQMLFKVLDGGKNRCRE